MEHQADDNRYTRGIAEFVSEPALRRHSRGSADAHQATDARFARLRALRRRPRMEPHHAAAPRRARYHAGVRGVGHASKKLSAPHAALVNGTQVQGFELDDVHRQGVLHVGAVVLPALISITEMRPGMSGKEFLTRRGRGLRDRAARRHLHGPRAYRAGLAFGRHARRVLRRRRRRARPETRRRTRPCTRSASPARRPRA